MTIDFKIEHIAIWVKNLDNMKDFYQKFFNAKVSVLYHNPKTNFKSYFLTFNDSTRIELMCKDKICETNEIPTFGYSHIAFSVGNSKNVDAFTQKLIDEGIHINSMPRTTGDGCYESSIFDPEDNLIEITE